MVDINIPINIAPIQKTRRCFQEFIEKKDLLYSDIGKEMDLSVL